MIEGTNAVIFVENGSTFVQKDFDLAAGIALPVHVLNTHTDLILSLFGAGIIQNIQNAFQFCIVNVGREHQSSPIVRLLNAVIIAIVVNNTSQAHAVFSFQVQVCLEVVGKAERDLRHTRRLAECRSARRIKYLLVVCPLRKELRVQKPFLVCLLIILQAR